ncbi:MAG: CHRD domain-containing protein [Nitrospinota bacterium]|nr:MAG: CHRD domain-containing protein [Nitrospinota bacterium]
MKKLYTIVFLTLCVALFYQRVSARDHDHWWWKVRPVFRTVLSGAQEVPEVVTDSTGRLQLRFDRGMSRAEFQLYVFDGVGVTAAHLHCASAGVNGPVIALLFEDTDGVDVDGLLARGTLTNADISPPTPEECGVVINNIASLFNAILQNQIYVNVHTIAHPEGEIRGQLFPLPAPPGFFIFKD